MTSPTIAAVRNASTPHVEHELVHLVTVTHNSAATVGRWWQGVSAAMPRLAGVTVVDNASTDNTVELLRRLVVHSALPVEIIDNTNNGFAGGYRAAAQSSVRRNVPVLCVNPDVALAEGAVDGMLDVLNSFDSAAVVTAPLVELDGSPDTASRRKLPTLSGSVVYSVLGRLTPKAIRYNRIDVAESAGTSRRGRPATRLAATTGALMLVAPDFRSLDAGIFDTDYWMYGEDLQLCADAAAAGRTVLMAEIPPSIHVKGVSSGRPRSTRSNRAFHRAMVVYARKNLVADPALLMLLGLGVALHFGLTEARALPARLRKRVRNRR